MAENSKSDADRASWLRIAQQWLRMLGAARGNETVQKDQLSWPESKDDDFKSAALGSWLKLHAGSMSPRMSAYWHSGHRLSHRTYPL